jgi:hypothetical protein
MKRIGRKMQPLKYVITAGIEYWVDENVIEDYIEKKLSETLICRIRESIWHDAIYSVDEITDRVRFRKG